MQTSAGHLVTTASHLGIADMTEEQAKAYYVLRKDGRLALCGYYRSALLAAQKGDAWMVVGVNYMKPVDVVRKIEAIANGSRGCFENL